MSSINRLDILDVDSVTLNQISLWSDKKTVVSNELYIRNSAPTDPTDADLASQFAECIANEYALSSAAKTDLYLNVSPKKLMGRTWGFLDPRRVVVVVPPLKSKDPARVEQAAQDLINLREKGFRLAFQQEVVATLYKSWQPLADFVKMDLTKVPPSHLGALVSAIRTRTPATAIATNVNSAEQFTHVKSLGVGLFQGSYFSTDKASETKSLSSEREAAMELLRQVSNLAPIAEIEAGLKKAPALGDTLLRIINSTGAGLSKKVTSMRQAIKTMGYEQLAKWSAVLLAMSSLSDSAANTVPFNSLVRARMMELLAEQTADELEPDSAFMVGLLSSVDVMLESPMQRVLSKLSLNGDIVKSLFVRDGVLGDMLTLAEACETQKDCDFAKAFSKLDFTLKQIHTAHIDALVWTDDVLQCV